MVTALDLNFLGRPGAIAAGLIEGPGGLALVDPGPASCLDGLRASLARHGHRLEDVDTILVTHIHLDHSGGVGVLVRSNPRLQVYVHRRGAPHVVDPSKLVSSASRLYGDRMGPLWGEILPVPAEQVHALDGGEVLQVAGVEVRVAYTPGHAVASRQLLRDVERHGVRGRHGRHPRRASRCWCCRRRRRPTSTWRRGTPAWRSSGRGSRSAIFITHFGGFDRPLDHLADLEERLHDMAGTVRTLMLDQGLDDEQRQRRFADWMIAIFRDRLPDETGCSATRRRSRSSTAGRASPGTGRSGCRGTKIPFADQRQVPSVYSQ